MSENRQDLLFGSIAVQLGLLSQKQVQEALEGQKELQAAGDAPKKIGEILTEARVLTKEQCDRVFRAQGLRGGHVQIQGYKILSRIGHGAMGNVYKGLQISMDRVVALKVLAPKFAQNSKFVERFFREARAVAKLNHPNIMQGIDVGESNGIHYFAMEFIDGPTVGQLLRRGGALDEKRSGTIVLQMAKALDHAQRHGMVHRDVKPDNVMLTRTGQAKLCDLGLAKVQRSDSPHGTDHGVSMGTPNYISPEQARGDVDVDIRSDIYSLGATVYHMVTGQVPFFSESAAVVIARHLNEPPKNPRELNPLVSEAMARTILKMMAKDRTKRHSSPAELVREIEAFLAASEAPAVPPPAPGQPAPPSSSSSAINRPTTGNLRDRMAKRRNLRRDY